MYKMERNKIFRMGPVAMSENKKPLRYESWKLDQIITFSNFVAWYKLISVEDMPIVNPNSIDAKIIIPPINSALYVPKITVKEAPTKPN